MAGDTGFKDPFDRSRLEKYFPDALLLQHFAALSAENRKKKGRDPNAGGHNQPHFRMMKAAIRDACRCRPQTRSGTCSTIIFGAKECNDIPLEILAREGQVYLVDVDAESLKAAKHSLQDDALCERIKIVCMDASLFETVWITRARDLLQQHHRDMESAFQAIVAMHREADAGGHGCFQGNLLPINRKGTDLAISSMTLSQFIIGYIQIVMKLFLEIFGKEKTRRYFLSGCRQSGKGLNAADKIEQLQRSTLPLVRSAAKAHIRELSRIVKDDGLVFISDHALHGQGLFVSESELEVDLQRLVPYSKNREEEKYLSQRQGAEQRLPNTVKVEIGHPDETFTVAGADALKTLLTCHTGIEILSEQRWWWVTERVNRLDRGSPDWYVSFVEAYAFRQKRAGL